MHAVSHPAIRELFREPIAETVEVAARIPNLAPLDAPVRRHLSVSQNAHRKKRRLFPDVLRIDRFMTNGQLAHFHVQPIRQLEARRTRWLPRLNPRPLWVRTTNVAT